MKHTPSFCYPNSQLSQMSHVALTHTWQEAAGRWLRETTHKADHAKDISKLRWLDRYWRELNLNEITRAAINDISTLRRQEVSAATTNRYLALIRAILRRARDDWEWIVAMPRIRLFPEPLPRARWLTHAEAARLLNILPTHLAAMARFSLATGLRQRNVTELRWENIDINRGIAWIPAEQSKSRRALAVPLNRDALTVIEQQSDEHPIYVFTYRGKSVARTSTQAWRNALTRADITNFRWHDLRHTWASWHVQSGTSLLELRELGGWSSLNMVLRYAHLAGEHLRQAASRIEGALPAGLPKHRPPFLLHE